MREPGTEAGWRGGGGGGGGSGSVNILQVTSLVSNCQYEVDMLVPLPNQYELCRPLLSNRSEGYALIYYMHTPLQARAVWRYCSHKLYLYQLILRSAVFYALTEYGGLVNQMLLMISGDVESNPGPSE